MSRALMPNMLTPQDLEPNWEWRERLPAWGHTSVDQRTVPELPGIRQQRKQANTEQEHRGLGGQDRDRMPADPVVKPPPK